MMKHRCPVCAYPDLTEPPTNYLICPCCGTEFGNDDTIYTHQELRDRWVRAGMHWFSHATLPPGNWNPLAQLQRAGWANVAYVFEGNPTRSFVARTGAGSGMNIGSQVAFC